MTEQHALEPWVHVCNADGYDDISDANGCTVCILYVPSQPDWEDSSFRKHTANARRIVACANACAGLNPTAVPKLLEACMAARGHIREEYGDAERNEFGAGMDYGTVMELLEAAIAAAESQESKQ